MIEQAQVFSVAPHVHRNDTHAELRGVYADILKLQVLTCFFSVLCRCFSIDYISLKKTRLTLIQRALQGCDVYLTNLNK